MMKKYNDALTEWDQSKQQMTERQKQQRVQAIQSNREQMDATFDKLAAEAGFIGKDGKSDDAFMDVVANATLAKLHATARDPQMPTEAELKAAFASVTEGLKRVEKRALGKAVVGNVPPSGSARGSVPAGKTSQTDDDRINDIVGSL